MTAKTNKGQRRLRVSAEKMQDMLVNGRALDYDVPADARLTGFYLDDNHWVYVFLFESRKWEPLEEGEIIPLLNKEGQ